MDWLRSIIQLLIMSVLRMLITLSLSVTMSWAAVAQEPEQLEQTPADAPAVASAGPGEGVAPEFHADVAGLGAMSCQAVNQRYSANFRYYESLGMTPEAAYWTSFQGMLHWALGYMSHRNLALSQTGAATVNLQPVGFDHARQLDFLRDWCINSPTLTFNDAVEALFADLAFARPN